MSCDSIHSDTLTSFRSLSHTVQNNHVRARDGNFPVDSYLFIDDKFNPSSTRLLISAPRLIRRRPSPLLTRPFTAVPCRYVRQLRRSVIVIRPDRSPRPFDRLHNRCSHLQFNATPRPQLPRPFGTCATQPDYSALSQTKPSSATALTAQNLPGVQDRMLSRVRNFARQLPKVWASTIPDASRTAASVASDNTLPGAYTNSSEDRNHRLFDMDKLGIPEKQRPMFLALNEAVRDYMYQDRYDPSHDYEHVQRVVMFAHKLYMEESNSQTGASFNSLIRKLFGKDMDTSRVKPDLDITTMYLAAMMHDVGESKYKDQGKTQEQVIIDMMHEHGACTKLAQRVADIAVNVSFTREYTASDKNRIQTLIQYHPELAFVQDADRLDAIGVVGQGRCFVYGGANPVRRTKSLHRAVQMQHLRFRYYIAMMKTPTGRAMAEEKWARMQRFREEWHKETDVSAVL